VQKRSEDCYFNEILIDKRLSKNFLQPDPKWTSFIVQSALMNVIQITSKVDFMAVVSFVVTLTDYCYLIKRYMNKLTHSFTDNGNMILA